MRRTGRILFLAAIAASATTACNAIFGIDAVELEANDGGADAHVVDGTTAPPADASTDVLVALESGGGFDATIDGASDTADDASDSSAIDANSGDAPLETTTDATSDRAIDGGTDGNTADANDGGTEASVDAGVDSAVDAGPIFTNGDCQTTACTIGSSSGTQLFASLAADGANVYILERLSGSILSCPLTGCPESGFTTVVTSLSTPTAVTSDGTNIYWMESPSAGHGLVRGCNPASCATITTYATGLTLGQSGGGSPSDLVVGGGVLYWIAYDTGSIMGCSTAGCARTPSVIAATQASPNSLFAGSGDLFWSNNPSTGSGPQASIEKYVAATSTTSSAISAIYDPQDMVFDGTTLYWVKAITGSAEIDTLNLTTSNAAANTVFSANSNDNRLPNSLVIGASNFYFAMATDASQNASNGSIASCPNDATGCNVDSIDLTTIASNEPSANNLLHVGTQLYWLSNVGSAFYIRSIAER